MEGQITTVAFLREITPADLKALDDFLKMSYVLKEAKLPESRTYGKLYRDTSSFTPEEQQSIREVLRTVKEAIEQFV